MFQMNKSVKQKNQLDLLKIKKSIKRYMINQIIITYKKNRIITIHLVEIRIKRIKIFK